MDVLIYLVPIAMFLGGLALWGFIWSLKNNQLEDAEGAANRILFEEE